MIKSGQVNSAANEEAELFSRKTQPDRKGLAHSKPNLAGFGVSNTSYKRASSVAPTLAQQYHLPWLYKKFPLLYKNGCMAGHEHQ